MAQIDHSENPGTLLLQQQFFKNAAEWSRHDIKIYIYI